MNEYISRLLNIMGYGNEENTEFNDVLSYTEKVLQEKIPLHVII